MNWLAHVLLSENHIEHQLGNLLTDPLKGKAWEGASERFLRGIMMHKHIDTFTDTHPVVSRSKASLTPRGHLKGVVLDILYDHFLSLHWDRFCTIPREVFIEDFRFKAMREMEEMHYPARAREVISRVVGSRQLSSYAHMHGVVDAFRRIDARLSDRARTKDNCERYIPLIAEHREVLEEDFLCFFPELISSVSELCQADRVEHWIC
jgi:acyl carrier protein phosphodiesterase